MNDKEFIAAVKEIEQLMFYQLTPVRKQILFKHCRNMDVKEFKLITYKCFNQKCYNPTLEDIIKAIAPTENKV